MYVAVCPLITAKPRNNDHSAIVRRRTGDGTVPHFDFCCDRCGLVLDMSFPTFKAMCVGVYICPIPKCLGLLVRLPAAPSFVLKGPGFHANDYPKERES